MPTIAAYIPSPASDHELLIGILMEDDVQGIEERDEALVFFFEEDYLESHKAEFERQAAPFCTGPIVYELIQDRNWNEEWEKTIKPIRVGGFWIRPSWDSETVPDNFTELIIDPKMSFGTGYHETTRLMLGALEEMVRAGDRLLDAGTGTGVLAFAGLKRGAASALAFDFDPICKENAEENAGMNGLSDQFRMLVGTETVIPEGLSFEIVMANINREALRAMLPRLVSHLSPNGKIGLAGLLLSDREIMLSAMQRNGLKPIREAQEGDWWSVWGAHADS